MLELVIQLQNLDQDFSEADSRFLTNFVLPVLGLDKVINGMYASRYQSYLATNGWLDYNIESPTGFNVNNLADKLYQVYNYDNAEKVLDAPTRKYVDYINDPYPAQNWGSNYGTSYGRSPIFGGFGFQ